jgi:hypothetical protein
MLWEVLSRNGKKRCESTSTKSCWLAPATKEGRNDKRDNLYFFQPRKGTGHLHKISGAFSYVLEVMLLPGHQPSSAAQSNGLYHRT